MCVHMCSAQDRRHFHLFFDSARVVKAGIVDQTEQQEDSALAGRGSSRGTGCLCQVFPAISAVVLDRDDLVLGRVAERKDADLVLDDARMSRIHARLVRGSRGWSLRDLGSRNGVYVDGVHVPSGDTVLLPDCAVLRLGDSIFVFRADSMPLHEADDGCFPGISPLAASVRARVGRLRQGSGHVLVLGETGTGKERVARAIGGEPFVPLNCAELQRDLARSELFGHLRGAFSGAQHTHTGLIDAASGGAIFLDEIGELPMDVQGALLRFLEDGSYRPLGTNELRRSTVRVVAATNIDVDEAVRTGAFRRDLLARLRASNHPVELPPLRLRREDILGWAEVFLNEDCENSPPRLPWGPGAAECLLVYGWPENLRELRSVVRGVAESNPRWPVSSSALPERIQACRRSLRAISENSTAKWETICVPSKTQIIAALQEAGGNMNAVSKRFGLERTKLYRVCDEHGIKIESYRSKPHKKES